MFVLLGLFAVAGLFQGAIRAGFTLLGVVCGAFLAMPIGPLIRPLFKLAGITNTVWLWFWPPIAVFILLILIFSALGFLAHRPVMLYYKYHSEDIERYRLERLIQRIGACVGLITGSVCLLALGRVIYTLGYLTVQMASSDNDPVWLRFLSQARTDLQSTGLDKTVAVFDHTPKKFYETSDIIGLLYNNNPGVLQPLAAYPPFLTWGERPEIQDIANDKEFMESLQGHKATLVDMINNPKTQALINNGEIVQQMFDLNLQDLREYLEKGISPLYAPYKILGRWELDADQVLLMKKKENPDISAKTLTALKNLLATMSAGTTLQATPDNKIVLVLKGMVSDLAQFSQPAAAATRGSAGPPRIPKLGASGVSGLSANLRQQVAGGRFGSSGGYGAGGAMGPNMARRYGGVGPMAMAPPAAPAEAAPAEGEPAPAKLETKSYQGTWEGEGEFYEIKMPGENGKEEVSNAVIDGDELILNKFGQRFVFVKQI